MQQRHKNRKQYFTELANTAREFYLDYVRSVLPLSKETRVLEIGCGEGGNLLPFAEIGCQVTGIDICQERINEAKAFFADVHRQGMFLCQDFIFASAPTLDAERYDLVLVHDVIEHIEPAYKRDFFLRIKAFLRPEGVVFFGFPAWQNPFGGHQQIATGVASKLPFVHLFPLSLYKYVLKLSGTSPQMIEELMSIRHSRMTIEQFEHLTEEAGYTIRQRTLWLVNPHYKQKFGLPPRHLWPAFSHVPYLRNFYTTSAWYLLQQGHQKAQ